VRRVGCYASRGSDGARDRSILHVDLVHVGGRVRSPDGFGVGVGRAHGTWSIPGGRESQSARDDPRQVFS